MQVTSLMRQAAELNRDRTAVITQAGALSFAQAWARGVRLANGLLDLGVRAGDRVAGLEDNVLGCVDLYLGCAIAGAVRVPLYPRNAREAHASMLSGTGCVLLVTDVAYAESVAGLDAEVPGLQRILVRDCGYERWLAGHDDVDPMVEIGDDDWFVIRHSGGTTGTPNGVGYTHSDWVLNCRNWAYSLERMHRGSVIGHAGPISHASGYLFLPGWLAGAANLLFGAFEPATVIAMMLEHRMSHAFASPSLLAALVRHPGAQGADWGALRSIMVGGAPITDATARAAREVFGEVLFQGYGQTEAVPLAIMGPEDWFADVPGSTPLRAAGRVAPYAQVEIRDEDGNPLPIGQDGEIVDRVEGQMHGYWGDPELSKTRLVGGWVHTRDIGRLDHNGFLYVLDRADDMIISGGFNIWPAELETVIADLRGVLEVAVFGVPHQRWGETPMAVVSIDPAATLTAEQVITNLRDTPRLVQETHRRAIHHRPAAQERGREAAAQTTARTTLGTTPTPRRRHLRLPSRHAHDACARASTAVTPPHRQEEHHAGHPRLPRMRRTGRTDRSIRAGEHGWAGAARRAALRTKPSLPDAGGHAACPVRSGPVEPLRNEG